MSDCQFCENSGAIHEMGCPVGDREAHDRMATELTTLRARLAEVQADRDVLAARDAGFWSRHCDAERRLTDAERVIEAARQLLVWAEWQRKRGAARHPMMNEPNTGAAHALSDALAAYDAKWRAGK